MRRLCALSILLAFVAALAKPALAACRMHTGRDRCCCAPAPANALCAPDCCARARPLAMVELTTHLRGVTLPALVALAPLLLFDLSAPSALPRRGALVGLHERAAPRLPLRI